MGYRGATRTAGSVAARNAGTMVLVEEKTLPHVVLSLDYLGLVQIPCLSVSQCVESRTKDDWDWIRPHPTVGAHVHNDDGYENDDRIPKDTHTQKYAL